MKDQEICPPKGLRKVEIDAFQRVIAARNAARNPIMRRDFDLLVDYARCRGRLDHLQRLLRRESAREDERLALSITRQIDATTAQCRKLAAALGLA